MGVPSFGNGGHALSCDSKGRGSRAREVGVPSPHAYQLILCSWARLGLCSSVFLVYRIEIVYTAVTHGITFLKYVRLRDIRHSWRHVRSEGLPSSSSNICSNPTFCPRACFALEPQTIALNEGFSISDGSRDFRKTSQLQLFCNLFVNSITKVFHGALPTLQHHRGRVVRRLASWFGVHTDQIKCLPHFVDELVDVEPFVGGYGDTVRDLVQKVKFFD